MIISAKCHRCYWKETLEQEPACFSQVNATSPALRSNFPQLDLAVAGVAQHQEEGQSTPLPNIFWSGYYKQIFQEMEVATS